MSEHARADKAEAEAAGLRTALEELAGCDGNCACAVWKSRHEAAMALYRTMSEQAGLRTELAKAKASAAAWSRFANMGQPSTPAEHDPSKHQATCARLRREDDKVIAAMCGSHVYDPGVPCSCGADPNWKNIADGLRAQVQALRDECERRRVALTSDSEVMRDDRVKARLLQEITDKLNALLSSVSLPQLQEKKDDLGLLGGADSGNATVARHVAATCPTCGSLEPLAHRLTGRRGDTGRHFCADQWHKTEPSV